MAADIITITINLWKKETQNLAGIVCLAGSLLTAKPAAKCFSRKMPEDFHTT
jgi:hypothetical protein